MMHLEYLPLVIGGITLAVAVVYMRRTLEEEAKPKLRQSEVMTPEEVELFNLLRRALPDHHIFPKISTRAIIDLKQGTGNKEWADRLDKHVCDFAVYTRRMRLECILEVSKEDCHASADPLREALRESTRIKVWRLDPWNKPTEAQIQLLIYGHDGPAGDTVLETVVNLNALQPRLRQA
jgi:hypothetical protein